MTRATAVSRPTGRSFSALSSPLRACLLEHRIFIGLVLAYALVAWCVMGALGQLENYSLFSYLGVVSLLFAASVSLFVVIYPVYVMVAIRPKRLVAYLYEDLRDRWLTAPRLMGGLLVFCLMPLVISIFSSMKGAIPLLQPFSWDVAFLEWDRFLHGGADAWRLLQPLLGFPWLTSALNFCYNLWFFVLYGILFWQAFSLRDSALRQQFLLSFILIWALLGNLLAVLWSSAGPIYFGRVTGLDDPFVPLMEYLYDVAQSYPLWALDVQEDLWRSYVASSDMLGGGISAMPSLHVATATLFALLGWRVHPLLGAVLVAYAVIIFLGSVHLAWHYAVDGYVSVLLTVMIWRLVGRLTQRPAAPDTLRGEA